MTRTLDCVMLSVPGLGVSLKLRCLSGYNTVTYFKAVQEVVIRTVTHAGQLRRFEL